MLDSYQDSYSAWETVKEVKRKITPEAVDQMVEFYKKGYSIRHIAKLYHSSYGTVHSRLSQRGVEFRHRNSRKK